MVPGRNPGSRLRPSGIFTDPAPAYCKIPCLRGSIGRGGAHGTTPTVARLMLKYTDLLALAGNTPIVELKSFDTGPCRLFVKLESQNPTGSIKDRIAISMIDAAERSGALKPGGRIIEATAGNTGLALALVAIRRGYRLALVIPDKMSREKIAHLRALGTEVVLTRSDVPKGHPDYYQDLAIRIARETGAFYTDQFNNPNNPAAHERTTGPEIWAQMAGEVDAVVAGVGSGGTITGLSRFFAKVSPRTEMVLADPKGSILADYIHTGDFGEAGSWLVEGIGEDFIPPVSDLSRVRKAYTIPDSESFAAGAGAAQERRSARGLVFRDADRSGAAVLPRADGAEARRHLRLRFRQQVPLQDVRRPLDDGAGAAAAASLWRFARPHCPPSR